MSSTNLYDATKTLQAAMDAIIQESEIDKFHQGLMGTDATILLNDYSNPASEPFPTRENLKTVERPIKGNTSITEVEKLIDL